MEVNSGRVLETNISNAVSFSIDSSNAAKLFSMLGSFLYSEKEKSVLHELSANAYDAHKMVGKENVAFDISLPDNFDSNIRVRDYGPGLSEENVIKFLTSYGASDKQTSNDFIGGWGIGSKSPAAVSDTWKVTSHHNGELKEYLVFVSATGVPSLTKIRTAETVESGLEVVIPVPTNKHSTWRSVAAEVFKFYPVRPNIKNGRIDYKVPKETYVSKDGSWSFVDWGNNGYGYSHPAKNSFIVASNREYPLVIDSVVNAYPNDASMIKAVYGMGVMFKFPVGSLDLSISREQLQYTKRSIDAIFGKMKAVFDELKTVFDSDTSSHKDEIDYRISVSKWVKKFTGKDVAYTSDSFRLLVSSLIGGKYGIKTIPHDLNNYVIKTDIDASSWKMVSTSRATTSFVRDRSNVFGTYSFEFRARRNTNNGYSWDVNVSVSRLVDGTAKVVIADCRDAAARIRYKRSIDNSFVLHGIIIDPSHADVFSKLGADNIIKASSLDSPPKATYVRQKATGDIYVWRGSRFVKSEFDATKKYAYVKVDSFASGSICEEAAKYNGILSDFFGTEIIGVKTDLEQDQKTPTQIVKEWHDSFVSGKEFKRMIESEVFNLAKSTEFYRFKNIRTPVVSDWNSFFDKYVTPKVHLDYAANAHQYSRVCSVLGVDKKEGDFKKEYQKDLEIIREKYKLVLYLDQYSVTTGKVPCDHIIRYIESVK